MISGRLRILLVSMECVPFAQAGGMAEAVSDLARALARAGHDARVVIPWYPFIDGDRVREIARLTVAFGARRERVVVGRSDLLGLPVYVVGHRRYTARMYRGRADRYGWRDEPVRHRFFAAAVATFVADGGWRPDVIQLNDHHTGLVPAYLGDDRPAIVHAIHNAHFQGGFHDTSVVPPALRDRDGAPLPPLGSPRARFVNFLRRGIRAADAVVAVSPTYAREIAAPGAEDGLADLFAHRAPIGIVNGIDAKVWDPARDRSLAARYDARTLERRSRNKRALQRELGLPVSPRAPLVAIVARLSKQKGFDLVLARLGVLAGLGVQLAVLGDGDFEPSLRKLARAGRGFLSYRAFDRELEPLYYAGADVLLVPSHYEPCGLVQLKALRYGAVPVVHRVGGLADTVREHPRRGNGFTYDADDADAMIAAIERALAARARPAAWRALQRRGMALDASWERAARAYVAVYRRVISRRGPAPSS